ncbi:hypothetical protein N7492_009472 [Penicillium capsulatum]|uniref:Uncharacterized protein n=1 Tax=Penicillium capsulatum TaxID=69766 RepID=A0A9W9HUK5_9EURO|nr:hypothetical protein N7492_009472 [Penicillium capsulatum]KAJ6106862.1 hypothetical protein N7512_010379 [Penicillium capsulatum]
MVGRRDRGLQSSRVLAMVVLAVWFSSLFPAVLGLKTTPGSPCTDICGKTGTTSNTTSSEITCLDSDFDTGKGSDFQKCISCQLESKHSDSGTGETDVDWALYNLRFSFTSCVFNHPAQVTNTTSPCPVACDGIRTAAEYDIGKPDSNSLDNWCSQPSFADNVVNTCTFCYNLTSNQVYQANFLESIRYNCHFQTPRGHAFNIAPSRIFTQVLLPSSMSLTTPGANSSNVNLGVVIALPILGFIIILLAVGACCFFFIRHRRKRVRENRMTNQLYARWNDPSMGTPKQGNGGWPAHDAYAAGGYGTGQGFGFVDNDGRGQEVGYGHDYSKHGFPQEINESGALPPHAVSSHGTEYDRKPPL